MSDHQRHKTREHERQRIKKKHNITQKAANANPLVKLAKKVTNKKEGGGGNASSPFVNKPKTNSKPKPKSKPNQVGILGPGLNNQPNKNLPNINSNQAPTLRKRSQFGFTSDSSKSNGLASDLRRGIDVQKEYEKRRKKREEEKRRNVFNSSFADNVPWYGSGGGPGVTLGDKMRADAAVKYAVQDGKPLPETEHSMYVISRVLSGDYSYGTTDKDWEEWQKKAYISTGNYITDEFGNKVPEKILRSDAPAPPLGKGGYVDSRYPNGYTTVYREKNEDTGEWEIKEKYHENQSIPELDRDEFLKAWNHFRSYNSSMNSYQYEQEQRSSYMADMTDSDAANSLFDVARDAVAGKKNFFTGAKEYVDNYIMNPLKNKDWTVLGVNTVVNLVETLDAAAVGVRSMAKSHDLIGRSGDLDKFEGQKVWWYSKDKKDTQSALVELGADKLLTGAARSKDSDKTGGSKHRFNYESKEQIEEKIKKAGLWEEYLEMKSAWSQHQKEYRDEGKFVESLKDAYTTHDMSYYDASGKGVKKFAKNMLVEMVMDPTLLVGGLAKGFASSGAKGAAKSALKEGLEETAKHFFVTTSDDGVKKMVNVLTPEAVEFIDKSDKTVKQIVRNAGGGLLTKNPDKIKNVVNSFANVMEKEGHLAHQNRDLFKETVTRALETQKAAREFNFVKSLHRIDSIADGFDSVLLKSAFAFPYVPVKAFTSTRKVIRNSSKYAHLRGTLRGQAERSSMRAVMEGLREADGSVRSFEVGKALERTKDTVIGSDNERFNYEVIREFTKSAEGEVGAFQKLLDDFKKVKYSPDEIDAALNDAVWRLTRGDFKSYDAYKDHLDNVFNRYASENTSSLDKLKSIWDNQFKSIEELKRSRVKEFEEDLYKELSRVKDVDSLRKLVWNYTKYRNHLSKSNGIDEDLIKRFNELSVGDVAGSVDDILRGYEFRNNTSLSHKGVNKVDGNKLLEHVDEQSGYFNMLHPSMKEPVKDFFRYLDDVWSSLSSTDKRIFEKYFSGYTDEAITVDTALGREITQEHYRGIIEDISPRDLHKSLENAIANKSLKIHTGNYRGNLKFDQTFINKLMELDRKLVDTQLSWNVELDQEIVAVHTDIFRVSKSYLDDTRMTDLITKFTASGSYFDLLDDMQEGLSKYLRRFNVSDANRSDIQEIRNVMSTIDDIRHQVEVINRFKLFEARLNNVSGLTPQQISVIEDSLFGFTRGNAKDFHIKASRNMEALMDKIELNIDTLFGRDSVALDNFRRDACDFSSDFYKPYISELEDNPELKERIKGMLSGGHLDPTRDVNTQLLQLILKDKGSIDYYNNLAKNQAVLFTDLENMGKGSWTTDIAFKKWEDGIISSDSSLEDILDFIEEGCSGKRFQSKMSDDFIDKHLPNNVLHGLFPNRPNDGRSTLLEEYKKIYGVKEGEDLVGEEDILEGFLKEIDKAYDEYQGTVPVIVTHSSRGSDMTHIDLRLKDQDLRLFPSHVVQTNDLINVSESTVGRLKGLDSGMHLTSQQSDEVKDCVVSLCKDLSEFAFDDMKIINPNLFDEMFKLPEKFKDIGIDKYAENGLEELVGDPLFGDSFDKLIKLMQGDDFAKMNNDFLNMARDAHMDTRRIEGNVLFNPIMRTGEDIGGARNLFQYSLDLDPEKQIPVIGYKVDISTSGERSFLNCFDVPEGARLSLDMTKKFTKFTEALNHTVKSKLRPNRLLDHHLADFQNIIVYAKEYAQDLGEHDPFAYFKYLKVPDTVNEAYVMAQMIWDSTLKYVKDDTIRTNTEVFKTLKAVSSDVRDYVLDFVMSGKKFGEEGLESIVSDVKSIDILKGEYGSNIIYKATGEEDRAAAFMTKEMEDVNDLIEIDALLDQQMRGGTPFTGEFERTIKNAEDYRLRETQRKMREVVNEIINLEGIPREDSNALKEFLGILKKNMNARREAMSFQILDYVTKSDDNLIAHLLFHNRKLIVPLDGSDIHRSQVNDLLKMMESKADNVPYTYYKDNDYLYVGIKKELDGDNGIEIIDDSEYVTDPTRMRIRGYDKEFVAPEYGKIDFLQNPELKYAFEVSGSTGHALDIYSSITKKMVYVYDQIDFLTKGKSVGSVGSLHSLSRERQLYKSMPKEFVDQITSVETSCDARFWHRASFDMTCLGDVEHMWKATDYNDADTLLGLYRTLESVTGSAAAERMYMDYFDNANSAYKMSNVLEGLDDAEKLQTLRNVDDMTVVVFKEAKKDGKVFESQTGVEVTQLEIKDLTDLKYAEASGAMLVPHEVFLDMQEVLNKSKFSESLPGRCLKAWSKTIWLYKVGQLCNPGTWMRNYIDATMKMTSDTGSLGETARYQVKAIYTLGLYNKISKKIKKTSGLNYTNDIDIERAYKDLPEKYRNQMSYEEWKFIDEWMSNALSGGESSVQKSIKEYNDKAVNLNIALKRGSTEGSMSPMRVDKLKQQFDLVGNKLQRFEELGEDEITRYLKEVDWNKVGISRDRFLEIFRAGHGVASDNELLKYTTAANKIIEKRFHKIRRGSSLGWINDICSASFTPMSLVEQVVRFSDYLALESQGLTKNQIFKTIEASQFNYDNKTMRQKMIEMLIPYYGFMDANLHYWIKQIDKDPRMVRYIEHIWGELSWDAAYQYNEDPNQNLSIQYMMLHGGIPIGETGAYLKTEPSFIQPLNLVLGSPSEYFNTLCTPVQLGVKELLYSRGGAYSAVFNDIVPYNYGDKSWTERVLDSTPIVGTGKTRYWDYWVKPYTADKEKRWERVEGSTIMKVLTAASPSLFGAVKRYNDREQDGFDLYLRKLEAQGKWYDQNTHRILPLSQRNTSGLNNPALSFKDRNLYSLMYLGKVWDNNVGKFVDVDQYRAGGLNRTFNFNNDGEWDEFTSLMKKYRGLVWDNNQRRFVEPDEVIPGMLNDPNLDWEDVKKYNKELFGLEYDANQNKFVQPNQYIKGGLNEPYGSWSFKELCALRYALFGEEWSQSERAFVKTTEPKVKFDLIKDDIENSTKLSRKDSKLTALERLGIIDPVYAGEGDSKAGRKLDRVKGKYVFTGQKMFDDYTLTKILRDFAGVAPSGGGWKRFGRWRNFGWRNFQQFTRSKNYVDFDNEIPGMNGDGSFRRTQVMSGIRSGGKIYSRPYTSGAEYAALKMATSGYKVYEDYYNFQFKYNYSYRSPASGPKKYDGSLYRRNAYLLNYNSKHNHKLKLYDR